MESTLPRRKGNGQSPVGVDGCPSARRSGLIENPRGKDVGAERLAAIRKSPLVTISTYFRPSRKLSHFFTVFFPVSDGRLAVYHERMRLIQRLHELQETHGHLTPE